MTVTYHNSGDRSNAVNNSLTYRGYYYDKDLGLYYLVSRYYDPNVCRFITTDNIYYLGINGDLNSCNLYAYCSNNPVLYYDPTGHWIVTAIISTVLIGGLIVGLTGSEPSVDPDEYINPNEPPNPESGYVPPKKDPNPKKVKNPNGAGKGWPDNEGGVWVPDNNQDGGPGWVQQFPGGKHKHRYPNGHVRTHDVSSNQEAASLGVTVFASVALIYIMGNNFTGIGMADDVVVPFILGILAGG